MRVDMIMPADISAGKLNRPAITDNRQLNSLLKLSEEVSDNRNPFEEIAIINVSKIKIARSNADSASSLYGSIFGILYRRIQYT